MGQPMEQRTMEKVAQPDGSGGTAADFAGDYPGVMVVLVGALFAIVLYLVKLKRGRTR